MKLLLDTHVLLWAAGSPQRLSDRTRKLLNAKDSQLFFSAASLWEIAIKKSLGRADFQVDSHLLRRGLMDNGYLELPIRSEHAIAVELLPALHKDPFDRLLLAQAMVEGFLLLTADEMVASYPGPVRKI